MPIPAGADPTSFAQLFSRSGSGPPEPTGTPTRYLFGDLTTREIIAELPMTSVSMDTKLNDWGVLRGTLYFDSTGINNEDIVAATTPGRAFVVCERGDTPIWDGIVWTSVYESQGKSLNITARSYAAYAEKQIMLDFTRTDLEQRNIFCDLWLDMQAPSNRNLGINVPATFPNTVLRSLDVKSSEYKNYLQVMSGISDGADGFDWTITTIKQNNKYLRSLKLGYPNLGATDVAGLSFEYPGNITNYWKTAGMTNAGTHLFLLGSGEGSDMKVGTAVQTDLIGTGFKRYDVVVPRKDIENQKQLNSMAVQMGSVRRPPLSVIKVFLKANLEPVFGSYGLGDTATVSILDPRHPNGFTTSARIVAMTYRPQSDDTVEQAELVFEGDDLNE